MIIFQIQPLELIVSHTFYGKTQTMNKKFLFIIFGSKLMHLWHLIMKIILGYPSETTMSMSDYIIKAVQARHQFP